MDCIKSQNQCINSVVFPGGLTKSTYDSETFVNGRFLKMIYIPFKSKVCTNFGYISSAPTSIPAILAINKYNKANIMCIHFHGNACDIAQIAMCAEREASAFNAHYLLVEYPRFGISNGHPNELVLNEIARIVHDFVIHELRINYKNVVLVGRSIGTGPTCSLASYLDSIGMPVAAVILQSPYTSLVDVTSDLLGCVSFFMLDRFPNWKRLVGTDRQVIKAPVLFIHADNDKVIDCNHSKLMHAERVKHGLRSELFIQQSNERYIKGHNYFEYEKDMVVPSKEFLARHLSVEIAKDVLQIPAEVLALYVRVPAEYKVLVVEEMQRDLSSQRTGSTNSGTGREGDGIRTGEDSTKAGILNNLYSSSSSSGKSHCNTLGSSKCTRDVICFWCLCPCTFTCECCVAMNYNCAAQCCYLLTNTRPAFDYRSLKPKEAHKGSLYNVLFRRKSFAKKVNEHDAAAAAEKNRHLAMQNKGRGRSDSMKISAGRHIHGSSSGASEVTNPMLSGSSTDSGVEVRVHRHDSEDVLILPVGTIVRGKHIDSSLKDTATTASVSTSSGHHTDFSGSEADANKRCYGSVGENSETPLSTDSFIDALNNTEDEDGLNYIPG